MGELTGALGIRERDVVAFVGAGGKTTAMFRAARELRLEGARPLVTTTTRIAVPPPDQDLELVLADPPLAARVLGRGHIPVVAVRRIDGDKLLGIPSDHVATLFATGATHVLVEADGAAGRPLKAPRGHEPVIPASATLVVVVVGADAVGAALSNEVAHTVERVSALTGLAPGDPVTAEAIARVMLGADGSTRGAPSGARVCVLVNKADTPERASAAHALAGELRRVGATRVVISSVASTRPIIDIWPSR